MTNTSKTVKKEITEIRAMRLSAGITATEMSKELGMPNGLYSAHDGGDRKYSPQRYEEFYKEVAYAIERIKLRRTAESFQVNAKTKKNKKGEIEEVLVYPPLSEELYNKALVLLATGKNIIQVSVLLGIDEEELEKKIKSTKGEEELVTHLYDVEADALSSCKKGDKDFYLGLN